MKFSFKNLDKTTRQIMIQEFTKDYKSNNWYISPRLTEKGIEEFPKLLLTAFESGDEETLTNSIKHMTHLKRTEKRKTAKGIIDAKVPSNANKLLAEGEFNRYYMIALCIRAIDENKQIKVYRGRTSSTVRANSEELIGKYLDPQTTLKTLKNTNDRDNHIPEPNSGITLELI